MLISSKVFPDVEDETVDIISRKKGKKEVRAYSLTIKRRGQVNPSSLDATVLQLFNNMWRMAIQRMGYKELTKGVFQTKIDKVFSYRVSKANPK